MVCWRIRGAMEEIDIRRTYIGQPTMFSIRLFHGGNFTSFPGRKYINGKQSYVDLIGIDIFSVHDIDDMMDELGYVEEGKVMYYHFKKPSMDLDFGLFALGNDDDVRHLKTYVHEHKVIDVFIEHQKTKLYTYAMFPLKSNVRIEELKEPPSCSRRLFLKWVDNTSEAGGKETEDGAPNVDEEGGTETEQGSTGAGNYYVEPLVDDSILDAFLEISQTPPSMKKGVQNQTQTDPVEATEAQSTNELSDSDDNDFMLGEENTLEDVDVDMREFLANVDRDVEWMGGSSIPKIEETNPEDVEVLNMESFYSGCSSDSKTGKELRKSTRDIRRKKETVVDPVTNPFSMRQTFSSATEVKDLIRKHAVLTRRAIELEKNDNNRIRAVCKGTIPPICGSQVGGPSQHGGLSQHGGPSQLGGVTKCPWVLLVSKWSDKEDWMVKTYNNEHKCLQQRQIKACTSTFLSNQIMEQVEGNPIIPVKALQEELQRKFALGVSRMKAYREKGQAMNKVRGDYAGQYSLLRDYVEKLRARNPDSTVKIDIESELNPAADTRVFKRIYICMGPLKKGFLAGKRDFLGLDGAFMKGPFPGQILSAVGLDGNNGTYPLAYVVVEAENINSWTWFLSNLGDDLGLERNSNFTFITDRQKGVLPAIAKLFPCAENKYCVRHIIENMKLRWKGKVFKDMLWKCSTSTTVQQFQNAMEEMKQLNKDVYDWLNLIPPQHWSKSHFTGRSHCEALLNNMCESFNSKIGDARDKPIITVLEFIREYLMKQIVTVQTLQDKCQGPLTLTATAILDKIKSDATQYRSVWNGGDKYQVTGPWMDQCVVNIKEKTCTYRRWELMGMPCKHAVAAIWDMQQNGQDVGIPETWVHPTYWLVTWKEMYSFKVEPINGRTMWPKSRCPTKLVPPKHHVPIGRPKKKRKKSVTELEETGKGVKLSRKNKSVTCSKCKNVGHNARSCKGQTEGGPQLTGNSSGAGVRVQRRGRNEGPPTGSKHGTNVVGKKGKAKAA